MKKKKKERRKKKERKKEKKDLCGETFGGQRVYRTDGWGGGEGRKGGRACLLRGKREREEG